MEEQYFLDKERIPVFIGKDGSMKKMFEEKFDSNIEIDSITGEVIIENEDSAINRFILGNIIAAVNFGHNPLNALKLEDENYVIDTIDVKSMLKDSSRLKIVLGRVIGKEGSTRRVIEEVTGCNISVRDHFVSIIGPFENTLLVHEALDMLIKGASHKSFYAYLERHKTHDPSLL